jgi:NitT/TauT family transport system substrate-binding protein
VLNVRSIVVPLIALLLFSVALTSCNHRGTAAAVSGNHVKIAYIGLTCEAPIFVAFHKGFFAEEGLDPELVKTSWDAMQQGLSFGTFDATHTLVPYLLKPIEQGVNVKITGGIHKGCLRIQAGIKTNIHSIADLRGKRIGVSTLGSPPMIFANRVFISHGLDVTKDVEWIVYPNDVLELALEKGRVDAVADSEPIGSLLLARNKVRNIVDQSVDAPYKDEYCCAIVVSGSLAKNNPAAAAKITRALLKAAKWVETNPTAAADLSIKHKYLSSTLELNSTAIAQLRYIPAVSACRAGVSSLAREMKQTGVLNSSTDPEALTARAWQSLDGVTDQWLSTVTVETVPNGGKPPLDPTALLSAMVASKGACCAKCCVE